MVDNIIIEQLDKLSESMQTVDNQIKDDAFSDLEDLSEEEKKQMTEKYKVNPWKYLFAKINSEYVGRVVLDKRNVKLGSRNVYGAGKFDTIWIVLYQIQTQSSTQILQG